MLLPITVLDLPSIIEAKKTIDYKTFYKSGDISQMMFVHDKECQLNDEDEIETFDPFKAKDPVFNKIVWRKDPDHRYKCRNGLAKGIRNIRARRFKQKHRYNDDEIMEVSKKLKSIIDNGAAQFENQMKQTTTGGDDIMDTLTLKNTENQSIGQSDGNANIKTPRTVKKIKKKAKEEFNTPASNNTKKFNINLSLLSETNDNAELIKNNIAPIKNNIVIPQAVSISPKEQEIYNEYSNLKDQYKLIKKQLEANPNDDEKARMKKKIKKRMKQIKESVKN